MEVLEAHKISSLPTRCNDYTLPHVMYHGKNSHIATGGIIRCYFAQTLMYEIILQEELARKII